MLHFRGPLLRELIKRGYDVHCVVPRTGTDEVRDGQVHIDGLRSLGAHVHTIPLARNSVSALTDLATLRHIRRLIRTLHPIAVVSYMMKPAIYGTMAAVLAGLPRRYIMLDGLGFAFIAEVTGERPLRTALLARRLLTVAIRLARHVIFLNNDDPKLLQRLNVIGKDKPFSVVGGTGLDLSHYGQTPVDPASRTVLMISRLLRDKGIREFAAAAAIVRARIPAARFVLIGEADEGPGSVSLAEVQGWSDVEYLGALSDIRPSIAASLICALPSYAEGRPRTVMEAMAGGRACVVTDTRGCRDCVTDGVEGALVPVKDVEALAEALSAYLVHPQKAVEHGIAARHRAEREFNQHIVIAQTLSALDLPPLVT